MLETVVDSLIETLKLVPFLFISFLIIELLEHKFSNYTKKIIEKAGYFGPLIGSSLGIFPQCGFSVMATNLYVMKIISMGTLISVYLSTSDEMLPLMLSHNIAFSTIFKILGFKFIIAIFWGFMIDLLFKNNIVNSKHNEICQKEECHCEKSLIKSTIKHTTSITIFIFLCILILNGTMELLGKDIFYKILSKNSVFTPFVTSIVGLIPSCASSVIITELYLNDIISLSGLLAGLLASSGVAIVVLFKTNSNVKNSLKVLILLYSVSVLSGLIVEFLESLI